MHVGLDKRWISRGTACMAAAVAVLCAAGVFFLLCERDSSLLAEGSVPLVRPATVAHPTLPRTPSATPAASPAASQQQVRFHLTRSRHFQRIGGVRMGLWKTDARRGLCDISVVAKGRRVNKRSLKLNEAISIDAGDTDTPLKLVIERIGRADASGYLVQSTEAVSESAPAGQPR